MRWSSGAGPNRGQFPTGICRLSTSRRCACVVPTGPAFSYLSSILCANPGFYSAWLTMLMALVIPGGGLERVVGTVYIAGESGEFATPIDLSLHLPRAGVASEGQFALRLGTALPTLDQRPPRVSWSFGRRSCPSQLING